MSFKMIWYKHSRVFKILLVVILIPILGLVLRNLYDFGILLGEKLRFWWEFKYFL